MRFLIFLFISAALLSCKQERTKRMSTVREGENGLIIDGPCVLVNPYLMADVNGIILTEDSIRQIEDYVKEMNMAFNKDSVSVRLINSKRVVFTDYFGEFPQKEFSFVDNQAVLAFYYPGKEIFTASELLAKNELDYEISLALGKDVNTQYYRELKIAKDAKQDSVMEETNLQEKMKVMEKEQQVKSDTTTTTPNGSLSPAR
jgi:hypothetical protein